MPDRQARRAALPRGKRSLVAASHVMAAIAAAAAAWASPASGTAFLSVDGIAGESTDERHKGQSELLGYDLPIVAPPSSTTGNSRGKVSCPSVTLLKGFDAASLVLAKKLAQGVHLAQAVITLQRGGVDTSDYYIIRMREIMVTEVTQSSSADLSRVVERIVLAPRRWDFEYKPQTSTGDGGGVVKFGWDCVTTEIN